MSSALFQSSFPTTIVIVLLVLLLAAGVMILLFARSGLLKRERDGHARERIFEMEREAQFAAAADLVPPTRNPADIAVQIARLLREYLSIQVLAVYAGRASDPVLRNVLAAEQDGVAASDFSLPASVPASLLSQHSRPAVVRLAAITGRTSPSTSVTTEPRVEKTEEPSDLFALSTEAIPRAEEPALEQAGITAEEEVGGEPVKENRTTFGGANQAAAVPSPDTVALLPWYGPFEWSGMIVSAAPEGIALGLFDPYREPLARLTNRLSVALDFHSLVQAAEQRASRTADFSRSLISCLEAPSPLDSIVREVTRLVGSHSAALWRVDEASGMVRMVVSYGLESPEFLPLPLGQGLAGHIAQSGEVLAIEDAPADPRCIFPREARDSGIVSYLGAPLSAEGKALGVIEAHRADRGLWSEGDQRALQSAAAVIADLIKSMDSRGNRLPGENAYMGLSESLQRLRSVEEVKDAVVEVLGHALGASRVIVVELNDSDQPEPVKQEFRHPSAKSALGMTFDEGLLAGVAATERDQSVAIAHSAEKSLAGAETAGNLGILSELAAPVQVDGKTRAIVYIHQCDRAREWQPEEVEFTERVTRQMSLSLSNLRSLEAALNDAKQARADAQRATEISREAPARIQELEQKLVALERELTLSRSGEMEAREMFAKASALATAARAEADVARRKESDVSQQLERLQEEHEQAQGSARQLLEINRLKSEFIVNAGHEMEASLQSVLGLAELLARGSYGNLTTEQQEAVRGIYRGAWRLKNDIDWLVEYGSARSRRLEPTGGD